LKPNQFVVVKKEAIIEINANEACRLARHIVSHILAFRLLHQNLRNHQVDGASLDGPQCNTHNPTLGLSGGTCLHTTSYDDRTRPQHTTQLNNKHHHHVGGATNPSGGVNLMNQRRPRGEHPCTFFLRLL
jgi:hypothetical protein